MDEDPDKVGKQGGVGRRRKRLLLPCLLRGKLDDRGPRAIRVRPCLHLHGLGIVPVAPKPIVTRVAQADAATSEGAWRGECKHHWRAHVEVVAQATIGAWDRKCSSGAGALGDVQDGGVRGGVA
jgi:hypothetical protein